MKNLQQNRFLAAALPLGLAFTVAAPTAILAVGATPSVAFARDEDEGAAEQTTSEAAKASNLVTALALPAGAQRITSKGDVATLKTQLVKMVKASGGSFGVGEVEALAWQGADKAEARRGSVVAGLKKQGFAYMPQKPNSSGSTTLTMFGAVNEAKKQGLVGFWMEGEENGIQILVWGRIGGAQAAEPAEDEPATPAAPAAEGGEGMEAGGGIGH